MKRDKLLPIISALVYSLIFGFSFMFSKIALDYMEPIELIAYRFLTAAVFMEVLRRLGLIKIDLKGKKMGLLILTSLAEPVLYFFFEVLGLSLTTTSEAGLMLALIPVFSTIFSFIILKEDLNLKQLVFIILSVGGVVFINLSKEKLKVSGEYLGIFYLFIAILMSSMYNIGSKKSSKNFKPVEITYVMMWTAGLVFNLVLTYNNIKNNSMATYFQPALSLRPMISILYLGILSSVVAFFMVNYTISKIPVSQSSIFSSLSTIVSIFAGVIILKESFQLEDIIGSIMILVGVWGTVYFGDRKAN